MASLQAGQPYEIYGLLQDGDLNVSGSVTPAKWATPIAFSFDFSSNSSTILMGMAMLLRSLRAVAMSLWWMLFRKNFLYGRIMW